MEWVDSEGGYAIFQFEFESLNKVGRDFFPLFGTSGNVYPAAGFAHEARRLGVHTVEFNLEPSMVVTDFVETRYGPATETLPRWVDEMLEG